MRYIGGAWKDKGCMAWCPTGPRARRAAPGRTKGALVGKQLGLSGGQNSSSMRIILANGTVKLMFASKRNRLLVVVVNLASRPPHFLGSASSAPEGLGSQIGANLVRD